ncbi:MAG TPA: serine/threonine-protein kinase [Polyangiales bacterium]
MHDAQRRELWGALLDGRYRLGRPLGSGATGVVFSARDPAGRELAVKFLASAHAADPELARRLRQEARVSLDVRHPGVVECVDQGVLHDGSPYVVFERVRGLSLLSLLRRWRSLSVGEALVIAQRTARVLAAVHAAGYVHRDVKPEHIVLCSDAPQLSVRLLDFGVCIGPASEPEAGRMRFGVYGTPGYASPEQAAADPVDHRSDLYGLGATLYEALTGRTPFSGRNSAVILTRTLREDPAPLSRLRPDCPRAVEALVSQLLARDPAERPFNARVVARELGRVSDTSLELMATLLHERVVTAAQAAGAAAQAEQQPTRRLRAAG